MSAMRMPSFGEGVQDSSPAAPRKKSSRRHIKLVPPQGETAVDPFDNPEFDSLVDEAVANTPDGAPLRDAERLERTKQEERKTRSERLSASMKAMRDREELKTAKMLEALRAPKEEVTAQEDSSTVPEAEIQHNLREAKRHENDRTESQTIELKEHILPREGRVKRQYPAYEDKVVFTGVDGLKLKLEEQKKLEGDLYEEMNRIRSERTFGSKIRGFFAKLTGGLMQTKEQAEIAEIERRIAEVSAQQDFLVNEIQKETHTGRQPSLRSGGRKAPITPPAVLAAERVREQEREEDRVAAKQLPDSTLGMEEEGAEVVYGLATPEEARKKMTARKKKEADTQKDAATAVAELTLPKGIEKDVEAYEANGEMSIDLAAKILGGKPRAATLWDMVSGAMKKNADATMAIGSADLQQHPATTYVFTAAEATRAQQAGDTAAYEKTMATIQKWNTMLGISSKDIEDLLNPPEPQAKPKLDRLRGVYARRDNVRRSNARFKY